MSYVLDGIPTAMTDALPSHRSRFEIGPDDVNCPCGWRGSENNMDALRFHYTNCPHAKVVAPLPEGLR